jgi:hypothetical protein
MEQSESKHTSEPPQRPWGTSDFGPGTLESCPGGPKKLQPTARWWKSAVLGFKSSYQSFYGVLLWDWVSRGEPGRTKNIRVHGNGGLGPKGFGKLSMETFCGIASSGSKNFHLNMQWRRLRGLPSKSWIAYDMWGVLGVSLRKWQRMHDNGVTGLEGPREKGG